MFYIVIMKKESEFLGSKLQPLSDTNCSGNQKKTEKMHPKTSIIAVDVNNTS